MSDLDKYLEAYLEHEALERMIEIRIYNASQIMMLQYQEAAQVVLRQYSVQEVCGGGATVVWSTCVLVTAFGFSSRAFEELHNKLVDAAFQLFPDTRLDVYVYTCTYKQIGVER